MPMLRRTMTVLLFAVAGSSLVAQAGATGLKVSGADTVWPKWQGRMLVSTTAPWWRPGIGDERDTAAQRLESLSLLGDYFFARDLPGLRLPPGVRATSGLIFGAASSRVLSAVGQASSIGLRGPATSPAFGNLSDTSVSAATVPYLGLGYTSAPERAGWGFSADIGLVARSPGYAVKLGRVFGGTQPLDDLLREMRLSPLLNVGVSYSF